MDALDLAAALERGTRAPLHRAALALLLSLTHLYDRVDVVARWYTFPAGPGTPFGFVQWATVAADADRGVVPMSTGERAVTLLAASLADGHRVDLAELLPLLDDPHAADLIMAVHAVVSGRDPVAPAQRNGHERFAGQVDRDV